MLALAAILASTLVYTSCGTDDLEENIPNNGNSKDDEIDTSLSTNAKKFVGLWYVGVGSNSHDFIFLPNGRAMRDYKIMGKWTYNSDEQLLVTNIDMWSFNISAIFDDSWVGTAINTGRAASARKCSDIDYISAYLKMLSWKDKNGSDPFDYEYTEKTTHGGINRWVEYSDGIITDKQLTAKFIFYKEHWSSFSSTKYSYPGSIVIEKPYSNSPQLVITSDIIGSNSDNIPWAKGTYEGYWKS